MNQNYTDNKYICSSQAPILPPWSNPKLFGNFFDLPAWLISKFYSLAKAGRFELCNDTFDGWFILTFNDS